MEYLRRSESHRVAERPSEANSEQYRLSLRDCYGKKEIPRKHRSNIVGRYEDRHYDGGDSSEEGTTRKDSLPIVTTAGIR